MNRNKNISVKKILILYVLIIFVLSLAVISILSVYNLKKYKDSRILKSNAIIAQKFAEQIRAEFEKAILTTQISSETFSNRNLDNENLKRKLKNIVKLNKNITGINLFLGDISLTENINLIQDTSENFTGLSLLRTKNGIRFSSFNDTELKFYRLIANKFTQKNEIIISEPFKIKLNKQSRNLIRFTTAVYQNNKIKGYISIYYNTSAFKPTPPDPNLQCTFVLLSPEKNIIADSDKKQNTGKNILNLRGNESELYNQLHETNKTDEKIGNLLKISPKNTDSKFELLSFCKYSSDKTYSNILIIFIIISLIILISGIFFLLFISNKLFVPFKNIIKTTESLSKGEKFSEISENLPYEYKYATENLNKISNYYDEISVFAEEIISENYDVHLKERSSSDKSSKSLNKISDFLKKEKQERLKEEKEISRQLWMRKGRFEIAEAERFSSKDIEDLSYNIIRSVVNYIDALMGGIYLYNKEKETIELVAAYAYDQQKHFDVSFKPGEGIVGACVLEKKKVILKNIPEDYIKIATGLGSGRPSYIAVIPILFKNEINAAVEVAFMNKPEDYKIEFIEQLSDSIGSWIDASLISTKTAELLTISQKQTQELAEKEDELNKKVLELQEIQEKTAEINTRYESILNAVNQTIMTVEYSLDGTINNCNSVYTKIMGFEPEDIKGKNVLEIVKDQSEELKETIERVKKGESVKKQVKRYTKDGEEKQLTATYTPYYDKDGKISQILFFAFDITKMLKEN